MVNKWVRVSVTTTALRFSMSLYRFPLTVCSVFKSKSERLQYWNFQTTRYEPHLKCTTKTTKRPLNHHPFFALCSNGKQVNILPTQH